MKRRSLCRMLPVIPLLAIQVGTKVEFPNQDDTYHNIFSYSPPKRFDLGRYSGACAEWRQGCSGAC